MNRGSSHSRTKLKKCQPTNHEVEDLATWMLALVMDPGRFGGRRKNTHLHSTDAVAMRRVCRQTAPVVGRGQNTKVTIFFQVLTKKT